MAVAAKNEVFDQIGTPIGGVSSTQVMEVWDKVEPILARVVKPNTGYTLQDVLSKLLLGHFQLWIIGDFQGAIVTEIQDRPTGRVLWGQYMAGEDMKTWLPDWVLVQEAYARHHACNAIEFSGRRGWNRVVEQHPDYKATWTIFRRELE